MNNILKNSLLVLVISVLTNFSCYAEIQSFGHNLSHTDYTIDDKTCILGYQVVACGNGLATVAVSPFLLHLYGMKNIYLRFNAWGDVDYRNTFEVAYFNTFTEDSEDYEYFSTYKMEAIWLYHILTFKVSKYYKWHLNTNFNYYLDDTRPFSLRRPTVKRSPFQLNVTSLHEVYVSEHFGVMAEIGFLHLTDVYPRLHVGTSLVLKSESFLLQLGFSISSTYAGLFSDGSNGFQRGNFQGYLIGGVEGYNAIAEYSQRYIEYDFSLHPEFAIQYKF